MTIYQLIRLLQAIRKKHPHLLVQGYTDGSPASTPTVEVVSCSECGTPYLRITVDR